MKKLNYNFTRENVLSFIVDLIKLPYINILHKDRIPWAISLESLEKFDKHSLGFELYSFLMENDLKIQALYESHDVYHVLSGYGIGMVNEAKLFFFLLGNGKKSISVLSSILVAIILYPDKWNLFRDAYLMGKKYKPIYRLNFESLLVMDFHRLKSSLLK